MKSILVTSLIGGVVLLLLSSCATVPTEPLGPDELRLLDIQIPGAGRIKAGALYTINVRYETGGQPKIQRICYSLGGYEPKCSRATGIELGWVGTFQMDIGGNDIGPQPLEIYVEYIREGKIRRTNVVSTTVEVLR